MQVLIAPLWNWNKYNKEAREYLSIVLIAPLWNWNMVYELKCREGRGVLIAPLWNWNSRQVGRTHSADSSNRTFMELKFGHRLRATWAKTVLIAPLWNWNQCGQIMYVSFSLVLIAPLWNWNIWLLSWKSTLATVLIAPLWNWNMLYVICYLNKFKCSNRTFMELKYLVTELEINFGEF